MKKKLLAFLFVATIVVLTFVITANAAIQSGEKEGFSYSFDDETGVLTLLGTGEYVAPSGLYNIARYQAKKVIIGEGITTLPNDCFRYLKAEGESILEEVSIPSSLTTISKNLFRDCTNLTKVNIPEDSNITTINENAFFGCSSLTQIAFNDNLTTIGNAAFRKCLSLVSADMGNSITSMGIDVFHTCVKLESVVLGGTYTKLSNSVFYQCSSIKDIVIADTVTTIGASTFRGAKSMTEFDFPSAITTIGDKAFVNTGLTSIVIPDTVTSIGVQCFKDCAALANVEFSDNMTVIPDYAFNGCAISNLVVPENITDIGICAFAKCSKLASVTLGKNLVTIGNSSFANTAIQSIYVPENVTSIGPAAFSNCTNLESAIIDANIAVVERTTFKLCTALKNVTLPDTVTDIQTSAFHECAALESINIPNTLRTIGDYAFYKTTSLKIDLVLPDNFWRIYKSAFADSGITSLTIKSVEKIGERSFANCAGLKGKDLVIPVGCVSIGTKAFLSSVNSSNVYVPATVTEFGEIAFYRAVIHTEEGALTVIDYVNNDTSGKNTLGDTYVPEGSECKHANITVLEAVNATCTETGLTEGAKCSDCGETLTAQEEIPALGHTEETVAGKAATCTEAGLTDGVKCSVCGETLTAQEEIPALGHTEETVAGKAATCTEAGLTDGVKCSVCGETLTAQEEIPAPGHTLGNYEVTTTATPWNNGVKTAKCTVCAEGTSTETFAYEGKAVGLDVTINGTTATATLDLFNAPALTSLAFSIKYTAADLTLTTATAAELGGYTTDPSIANPVKFVWINGLENVEIKGTVVTFTFTIAEGATIDNDDFEITYEADDVCALDETNTLVNVELETFVRVTVAE